MIATLATSIKILTNNEFSADVLNKIAVYSGVETGKILFIVDPMDFLIRDSAISEFSTLRDVEKMNKIVPNPESTNIDEMAEIARKIMPSIVIAIGGGSTLDSAKAVNMLINNDGLLDDYLGPNPYRSIKNKGQKLVLIPTTTGTGSEATRFGVYTSKSGRKYTLASDFLYGDIALLCEALIAEMPASLVAVSGYDALTHALETIWNKNASTQSDLLAEQAVVDVFCNIKDAWQESVDKSGSKKKFSLLLAANAAGIAFNKTGTAAIHALSFIISEKWHLPHGLACAFFTDSVYEMNSKKPEVAKKLASIAVKGGVASIHDKEQIAVEKFGKSLLDLRAEIGLIGKFAEIKGFDPTISQDEIVESFLPSMDDPKMKNNIIPMDSKYLWKIVKEKL
jgi:alcohol dehydrogenase